MRKWHYKNYLENIQSNQGRRIYLSLETIPISLEEVINLNGFNQATDGE